MSRFSRVVMQGLGLCFAVVLFVALVLPPRTVRAQMGACAGTVVDAVLSVMGIADGTPVPDRVNESGAKWIVDSDLGDSFWSSAVVCTAGGETALVLPAGLRSLDLAMQAGSGFAPSSTCFIKFATTTGALAGILNPPPDRYHTEVLDIAITGSTLLFEPKGGTLRVWANGVVSQNTD